MKHLALVLLACAAAGAGCKKKSNESGGTGTGTGTGTAKPAEPFTGALTIDRVLGARDLVKPFDPWDEGFARLQALVGAPTKVEGARHTWAIVEGDGCAWFYVTRDNGADYKMEGIIVGTVQAPTKTAKGDGGHNDCLKAAGVNLGPPEDPNAAGPPADGSAAPLADVRANVIPGRSKWKDQKVSVAAVLGGVSTTTSGTDKFVTVNLTAGPDDKEEPLACALEKNAPAPDIKQGTNVVATGTMQIQEWTSMGSGEVTLKPSLTSCTLAPAK
ncbi:MAG: hypothetical protein K8M05_04910 [Deltaproteobacteria bacterium]|nr:hypothetical protein [Kofleriaceae bacterium]